MPDWIEILIFRHILRGPTRQLLGQLKTSYESDSPLPANAQVAIDQEVAAFEPPTAP